MAHLVETMAYAGEVPWHGLGKPVHHDLTPEQMMVEAGVNWEVKLIPAFAMFEGRKIPVNNSALVRVSDDPAKNGTVLDVVGEKWNPTQNSEAFDFFHEYVMAGDMEMHTAGSLKDGQIVWALAKVKDSFTINRKDRVDSYLLFTNPHMYGKSIDIRFTPIRVVCNNTLTLSLSQKAEKVVKVSHRGKFDAAEVKETLGIAHKKLGDYKEMAQFLAGKDYSAENVMNYFKSLFPIVTSGKQEESRKSISKTANTLIDILETQPGAEMAPGSWWNAFNAVTFYADHLASKTNDTRLYNSWYGNMKGLKQDALEKAVEMANAA